MIHRFRARKRDGCLGLGQDARGGRPCSRNGQLDRSLPPQQVKSKVRNARLVQRSLEVAAPTPQIMLNRLSVKCLRFPFADDRIPVWLI